MSRLSLREHLKAMMARSDAELNHFKEALAHDPIHALSWADSTYHGIAERELAQQVLKSIEDNKMSFTAIKTYILKSATDMARSTTGKSTSSTQNIMVAARVVVWSQLASDIQWMVEN